MGPMGVCLRKNIMNGRGISPILFPSRLGMDPASAFGMICGAKQPLSSLRSQNLFYSSRKRDLGVRLLRFPGYLCPLKPEFYQGPGIPRLGAGISSFSLICYSTRKSIRRWHIECCGCQLPVMALK
jgi:hypothetical protein